MWHSLLDRFLQFEVFNVVVIFLLATGLGVMGLDQYRSAKVCFSSSALLVILRALYSVFINGKSSTMIGIDIGVIGLTLAALYALFRWVDNRALTTDRNLLQTREAALAWETLATKFEQCSHFISANYQTTRNKTCWDIKGDPNEARNIEVLLKKAGVMLLKSEKSRACLGNVVAVSGLEPMDFWLTTIKNKGTFDSPKYVPESLNDGSSVLHLLGRVPKVAVFSYQLCMECSAYEL